MLPAYPLLHDVLSPVGAVILGLPIFLVIGLVFAFIGVFISRRYGPASLALSTGAFCLAVMVLSTTSAGSGAEILVPIFGGIVQGVVIAMRTRDGKGKSTATEACIGSGAFVAATSAALIVALIVMT